MSKNSSKLPAYEQRLRAREQLLEQRARSYEQDLQYKQQYLKSDGKLMVTSEIVQNVASKNQFAGKITNKLLGSPMSKGQLSSGKEHPKSKILGAYDTEALQERLSRLGIVVIPVLLTIGGRKILSYSFRTAGTLIRRSFTRSLRRKRKRRR